MIRKEDNRGERMVGKMERMGRMGRKENTLGRYWGENWKRERKKETVREERGN